METKISRIAIVDSDPLFNAFLNDTLKKSTFKVRITATSAGSMIQSLKEASVDILIMNLFLSDLSAQDLLTQVLKVQPFIKTFVISDFYHSGIFSNLQSSGVSGFYPRNAAGISQLKSHITAGQTKSRPCFLSPPSSYISESLSPLYSTPKTHNLFHESISTQKMNIIHKVCIGLSTKQISEELNLSLRTINTYLSEILFKFNFKNKQELMNFSYENGLCKLNCENSLNGICMMSSAFTK